MEAAFPARHQHPLSTLSKARGPPAGTRPCTWWPPLGRGRPQFPTPTAAGEGPPPALRPSLYDWVSVPWWPACGNAVCGGAGWWWMGQAAGCPRGQGVVAPGRSFRGRVGHRAPPVWNLLGPVQIFFNLMKDGWIMDEDEFAGKTCGEKEGF